MKYDPEVFSAKMARRVSERISRDVYADFQKIYPELRSVPYEDTAVVTPVGVRLKNGKVFKRSV